MRVLRLLAEYCAHPLWEDTPDVGDVDPAGLHVSDGLVADLAAWNDEYEMLATTDFAWADHDTEWRWWNRGLHLAKRLQGELGAEYEITYAHSEPEG